MPHEEILEQIIEAGAKAEEGTLPAVDAEEIAGQTGDAEAAGEVDSAETSESLPNGTSLQLLGSYSGNQISASVIFAEEGLSQKERRQRDPRYLKALAEVAGFVKGLEAGRHTMMQLQENMMSGDFTALLGDTLDRILLGTYATYAPTYRQFMRRRTVRDFRQVGSVRRHGGRRLQAVAEAETYPESALAESSYQFGVGKYGDTYRISWEAIINDDLDAFMSLPTDMASDAIQTEMYLASQLYVANATLYSTTHAVDGVNYSNKDTAALSIDALKTAYNAMVKYPGDNDKPLNNTPVWLVVPPALYLLAIEILGSLSVQWSGGDSQTGIAAVAYPTRNELANILAVIVDPNIPILDPTNGHTSWYLFSNPSMIHAAEFAFLRGYEAPQVFMRSPNAVRLGGGSAEGDFNDDTRAWKVRHIFGGSHANAAGGWRGTYWSDGTA